MKQLKKISLQKEELVSLNSPQLDLVRGGSVTGIGYTKPGPDTNCSTGEYDKPYQLYEYLDYLLDNGYVEYTSQWFIDGACVMTEVVVYP